MSIRRPPAGGFVPIDDENLAAIGLAVVYESAAKSCAGTALRALAQLSFDDWTRTERMQFSQIVQKTEPLVQQLRDEELTARFEALKSALENGHELRHIIVHVTWGEGGDQFVGYDYGRRRRVEPSDIRSAVDACADLKRASHWFALRVAELVALGQIAERDEGPGMSVLTEFGSARL